MVTRAEFLAYYTWLTTNFSVWEQDPVVLETDDGKDTFLVVYIRLAPPELDTLGYFFPPMGEHLGEYFASPDFYTLYLEIHHNVRNGDQETDSSRRAAIDSARERLAACRRGQPA